MTGVTLIETYPPDGWVCPHCGKEHNSGPHFAHEGQVDYDKDPGEPGRVRFNRRRKNDQLDDSMEIRQDLVNVQPSRHTPEGNLKPLFCPHCGWEAEQVILIRTGELPDIIDEFLLNAGINPRKTVSEILRSFMDWLKRRDTQR